jgi:ABC-2 type transport system ATP-binding protein
VLDVVGLTGRDREPVRGFSLGMKQRLGIAAALLPDPELLLLDEPTNGLDPAGIVEIRRLLRTLSAGGRTVVVSSHLLSEIEAICDHVVVIRFGELLFAGPMAELLTQTSEYIEVAAENEADSDRLATVLRAAGWNVSIDRTTARIPPPIRITTQVSDTAAVNRTATSNGLTLAGLIPRQETLEDVFLRLTGDTDGALAAGRAGQSGSAAQARGLRSRLEKAVGRAS